uniref:Uncharacterized protein n=1 Tax=Rhizophora mucronata TaxID=61149 RepID=A0A2P2P6K9_RHIMU
MDFESNHQKVHHRVLCFPKSC